MNKDAKLIILPDIHGRDFWKIAVDFPDIPVIFLGDYLDPYRDEKITADAAIDNFKQIIEFAESRDNVTMLLGNHDMTYELGPRICEVRTIYDRFSEIRDLFWSKKHLFKIADHRSIGDREFLFTHAGITPKYYREMIDIPVILGTFDEVIHKADEMNRAHKRHWEKFCSSLGMTSVIRGGWNDCGSLVWADLQEHILSDDPECKTDTVQVFGHTMCKIPIHSSNPSYEFYMLDSREPFWVDSDGRIRKVSSDIEPELRSYLSKA